jgi:squalene-hopene/tetraprenyl-beta-curcumene cyclase
MLRAILGQKLWFALALVAGLMNTSVQGAEKISAKDAEAMTAKAIDYLRTKGQKEDGSFSASAGPAVTALVTTALLRNGRTPEDPMVAKAIKYVEGFIQPDGGIHAPESKVKNYETCFAILMFSEANKGGKYDTLLKKADGFIKGQQWDEGEGKQKSDPAYGGAGYGKSARPDLSNTAFLVDALKATGNDADGEALQRALIFVSRTQNLETEHNTTPFAAKNPDGGFYYTPAGGGQSQAGNTTEGGLRSYGSMTYAGLKSMIYAGVKKDDPRVKAAIAWLGKNYKLDENPGMGTAGLYYYYQTYAKALSALGEDTFKDEKGVAHDWRQELLGALKERQQADGSWVNENNRWLEGDANLVTAYALLSLSYAQPKK